jgi:hypothetical protein
MISVLLEINKMRKWPIFISGLVLCVLTGCSTIQFVQHEQPDNHSTVNRWHHLTLNGLVEVSKPLDIKSICGKKAWTTISTEFTFYNAVPAVLMPTISLVSFYSSWTNKVKCYEPS